MSMPNRAYVAAMCAFLAAALTTASQGSSEATVQERLRQRLESVMAGVPLSVGGQRTFAERTLREFFERRLYVPAWTDATGIRAPARDLLQALRAADAEGLQPTDYHADLIDERLAALRFDGGPVVDAPRRVDLELLLTDAFLLYGAHCLAGHLDPVTIDPEWNATLREADLASVLESALAADRIQNALRELLPAQPGYAALRRALAEYRAIAAGGGWPEIPAGPKLERGSWGPRVRTLRDRLIVTGDLSPGGPSATDETAWDEPLEVAVRRFQRRHGLQDDGVVGPATLEALNVSATARVEQILVNLERWRWLPQELGRRHVLVNIADFSLALVESGETVLEMKVIVGRDYRRTPVFSGTMTYLVFNPSWEVPPSIAAKDLLPQIRKDPGYLSTMGFKLLQGWGADERQVDPSAVDWSGITAQAFPYRLRQAPGPRNALGRVKFMFPNRFNVYLHDTPSRELFERAERAFSSGCIRVQKPIELAEAVLAEDPNRTREAIAAALERGKEQTVRLPTPVPVHLLHWTAWVDEEGTVRFRRDLYGRDRRVLASLREAPPLPGAEDTQ